MKKVSLALISLGVLSGCATPTGDVRHTMRNVIISDAYTWSSRYMIGTNVSSMRTRYKTCMVLEEDTSYELCTIDKDIYDKVVEYGKNNSYKALIELTEMQDMIDKSKYVKSKVLDIRLREE